jgi:hypothetical protein
MPFGLGVVSIVHVLPFQASASVKLVRELLREYPTAVHAVTEVHDTPEREPLSDPVGLGVGSIAHVCPFQTSADV